MSSKPPAKAAGRNPGGKAPTAKPSPGGKAPSKELSKPGKAAPGKAGGAGATNMNTLAGLSAKFNVSIAALKESNPSLAKLGDKDLIPQGTKLSLPKRDKQAPAPPNNTSSLNTSLAEASASPRPAQQPGRLKGPSSPGSRSGAPPGRNATSSDSRRSAPLLEDDSELDDGMLSPNLHIDKSGLSNPSASGFQLQPSIALSQDSSRPVSPSPSMLSPSSTLNTSASPKSPALPAAGKKLPPPKTIAQIAERFDFSVEEVRAANPELRQLRDDQTIPTGAKIQMPKRKPKLADLCASIEAQEAKLREQRSEKLMNEYDNDLWMLKKELRVVLATAEKKSELVEQEKGRREATLSSEHTAFQRIHKECVDDLVFVLQLDEETQRKTIIKARVNFYKKAQIKQAEEWEFLTLMELVLSDCHAEWQEITKLEKQRRDRLVSQRKTFGEHILLKEALLRQWEQGHSALRSEEQEAWLEVRTLETQHREWLVRRRLHRERVLTASEKEHRMMRWMEDLLFIDLAEQFYRNHTWTSRIDEVRLLHWQHKQHTVFIVERQAREIIDHDEAQVHLIFWEESNRCGMQLSRAVEAFSMLLEQQQGSVFILEKEGRRSIDHTNEREHLALCEEDQRVTSEEQRAIGVREAYDTFRQIAVKIREENGRPIVEGEQEKERDSIRFSELPERLAAERCALVHVALQERTATAHDQDRTTYEMQQMYYRSHWQAFQLLGYFALEQDWIIDLEVMQRPPILEAEGKDRQQLRSLFRMEMMDVMHDNFAKEQFLERERLERRTEQAVEDLVWSHRLSFLQVVREASTRRLNAFAEWKEFQHIEYLSLLGAEESARKELSVIVDTADELNVTRFQRGMQDAERAKLIRERAEVHRQQREAFEQKELVARQTLFAFFVIGFVDITRQEQDREEVRREERFERVRLQLEYLAGHESAKRAELEVDELNDLQATHLRWMREMARVAGDLFRRELERQRESMEDRAEEGCLLIEHLEERTIIQYHHQLLCLFIEEDQMKQRYQITSAERPMRCPVDETQTRRDVFAAEANERNAIANLVEADKLLAIEAQERREEEEMLAKMEAADAERKRAELAWKRDRENRERRERIAAEREETDERQAFDDEFHDGIDMLMRLHISGKVDADNRANERIRKQKEAEWAALQAAIRAFEEQQAKERAEVEDREGTARPAIPMRWDEGLKTILEFMGDNYREAKEKEAVRVEREAEARKIALESMSSEHYEERVKIDDGEGGARWRLIKEEKTLFDMIRAKEPYALKDAKRAQAEREKREEEERRLAYENFLRELTAVRERFEDVAQSERGTLEDQEVFEWDALVRREERDGDLVIQRIKERLERERLERLRREEEERERKRQEEIARILAELAAEREQLEAQEADARCVVSAEITFLYKTMINGAKPILEDMEQSVRVELEKEEIDIRSFRAEQEQQLRERQLALEWQKAEEERLKREAEERERERVRLAIIAALLEEQTEERVSFEDDEAVDRRYNVRDEADVWKEVMLQEKASKKDALERYSARRNEEIRQEQKRLAELERKRREYAAAYRKQRDELEQHETDGRRIIEPLPWPELHEMIGRSPILVAQMQIRSEFVAAENDEATRILKEEERKRLIAEAEARRIAAEKRRRELQHQQYQERLDLENKALSEYPQITAERNREWIETQELIRRKLIEVAEDSIQRPLFRAEKIQGINTDEGVHHRRLFAEEEAEWKELSLDIDLSKKDAKERQWARETDEIRARNKREGQRRELLAQAKLEKDDIELNQLPPEQCPIWEAFERLQTLSDELWQYKAIRDAKQQDMLDMSEHAARSAAIDEEEVQRSELWNQIPNHRFQCLERQFQRYARSEAEILNALPESHKDIYDYRARFTMKIFRSRLVQPSDIIVSAGWKSEIEVEEMSLSDRVEELRRQMATLCVQDTLEELLLCSSDALVGFACVHHALRDADAATINELRTFSAEEQRLFLLHLVRIDFPDEHEKTTPLKLALRAYQDCRILGNPKTRKVPVQYQPHVPPGRPESSSSRPGSPGSSRSTVTSARTRKTQRSHRTRKSGRPHRDDSPSILMLDLLGVEWDDKVLLDREFDDWFAEMRYEEDLRFRGIMDALSVEEMACLPVNGWRKSTGQRMKIVLAEDKKRESMVEEGLLGCVRINEVACRMVIDECEANFREMLHAAAIRMIDDILSGLVPDFGAITRIYSPVHDIAPKRYIESAPLPGLANRRSKGRRGSPLHRALVPAEDTPSLPMSRPFTPRTPMLAIGAPSRLRTRVKNFQLEGESGTALRYSSLLQRFNAEVRSVPNYEPVEMVTSHFEGSLPSLPQLARSESLYTPKPPAPAARATPLLALPAASKKR